MAWSKPRPSRRVPLMPAEEIKKRKESEEAAEFRSLSKPQESQESPRSREILNLSCCCVLPHIEQRSTSEMFYSTSLKQQSYPDDPLDSIENSLPRRLSCRLASITRLECFLFSRENESGGDQRRHCPMVCTSALTQMLKALSRFTPKQCPQNNRDLDRDA